MSNLTQEKLQEIADTTNNLVNTINDGVNWVDSYLEGQTKATLSYELKQHRRKLNKVKGAVVKKPTIAMFGVSQVGKSYLVKNILSNDKNELLISDEYNNEKVNFLEQINPTGNGGEATSLVTRFSYTKNPEQGMPPIKIRLLAPVDLLLIIIDSYFSDYKKRKISSNYIKSDITALLATFQAYYSIKSQFNFTEDDVYDVKEYLVTQFKDTNLSKIEALQDANFWTEVADVIHKVPCGQWVNVFSVLWGNHAGYTRLFSLLVNELQKLNFSKELFCGFDAVLQSTLGGGAILDVNTLNLMFNNTNRNVNLTARDNTSYTIDQSYLCAVSAEVIFNVSEDSVKNNGFIEKTDILDFPGARARFAWDENDEITDIQLTNLFLRGKVSYLFNSYSLRYEINNLFVCYNDAQLEVRSLPEIVNNWIEYNVGSTPQERSVTLQQYPVPPLFIVFTWWNKQLTYNNVNDKNGDYGHKWILRFETSLEKDIKVNYSWPNKWTENGKFKNYFLLRDFNFSNDVFSGFHTTNEETGVKPEREEYYGTLEKSFTSSNLVKQVFNNPQEVWDNTSTVGKDGSKYIIGKIAQINSNQIRTNRYLQIINDSQGQVQQLLSQHYHSGDKDKEIMKAAREASELHASMNVIFGEDAYRFGNFIEHFTIQEKDVFEFYHNKLRELEMVKAPALKAYQLFRESSPDLSSDKTEEENLAVLMRDYKRESIEDTKRFFNEVHKIDLHELFYGHLNDLKNNSEVLAEGVREHWFKQKLNLANFKFIIDMGLDEALLNKLLANMQISFDRSKITSAIAENIRTYVDTLNRVDLAEDMIAHITAGIINEFVTSCGWSFYPKEEKQKIIETNKALSLNLTLEVDEGVFTAMERLDSGMPEDMSIQKFLEYMANINEHLNKVPQDPEVVKLIPMVKNYRLWREKMKACFIANNEMPTYNPQANNNLGAIIEKLSSAKISVS